MNRNKQFLTFIERYSLWKRHLPIFLIIFGFLLSFYSFYFFMSNKIYLIGSDAFYYMSIADSIVKYGEMKVITAIPSSPVKTPQNGIVFVHVILSILGIGAKGRMLTIVVINYLLYLSGLYPLYKIARWSGLSKGLPLAALLSVYLSAWHIYRINLIAYNDGIFNSLMLWLVYLIIKFEHFEQYNIKSKSSSYFIIDLKRIVGIILMVMVTIHFRLNVILVIGSALLSAIAVRNYRVASWFLSACLLSVISCVAIYLFVEISRIDGIVKNYFYPLFASFNTYTIKLQLWKILPRLVVGLSGLTNPLAILLFTIFPLSMVYYGFKGIIERNFSRVFIAGVCITGLWFTLSYQNARVIWYIIPFIYLILFSFKKARLVGYAFVLLVFLQSLQQFYIGFGRGPSSRLWLYIYEKKISIPDNALLSSYRRRHPYFLLGVRNYLGKDDWKVIEEKIRAPGKFMPELTFDLIRDSGSLYVFGDGTYVDSTFKQVSEIAIKNGFEVEYNPITPDLDEFEGWSLVELGLFGINRSKSNHLNNLREF